MKKYLLPIFVFILAQTLLAQLGQDWKWLHPTPQGNTIRYVKRWDSNNWYAAGYGGTFMKTTDGGASWVFHHRAGRPNADGSTSFIYDAHFFNMNTGVVVGTSGIQRTTNGGTTFDTIAGLPTAATWYQVFFLNSTTGYAAGTTSGRLAVTTDAGLTWTLNTIIPSATYYDVYAYDKDTIYVSNSTGGVQKTTNAGLNWTLYSTGASAGLYKITFTDAVTGFVCGSSNAFRYTTNSGVNWTAAVTGLPSATFYDMDVFGSTVYLTGYSFYIYKSTNLGTSWDTVSFLADVAQQPWTSTYYSTDIFGSDSLITGGAFGLINKRMGEINKTVITNLKKPGTNNMVWAAGNRVIVLGASSSGGAVYDQILYSTNRGSTFSISGFTSLLNKPEKTTYVPEDNPVEQVKSQTDDPLTVTPYSSFYGIHMFDQNTGYICGSNSAIYKTTTGGASWDSVVTNIPAAQTLKDIYFLNSNTGWVCQYLTTTAGSMWKTVDGGANWTQITLTGQTGTGMRVYGMSFVNAMTGWCVNYAPRPFKTTDGGTTWTQDSIIDAFGGFMYDIQMLNTTTGYICGSSGKIYKTTNGGVLWDTLSKPVTSVSWNAMHFRDVNNGVIVGGSGTTIKTSNGGLSWLLLNNSGSTLNGVSMLANDTGFCAGSSGYIFKYESGTVGVISWQNEIPAKFELYQNFPNPFNPVTKIKFALPSKGIVSLKVYDVLGREVEALINNFELNAGTMTIDFDGTAFASGVYFYSLEVNDELIETKKMILVK